MDLRMSRRRAKGEEMEDSAAVCLPRLPLVYLKHAVSTCSTSTGICMHILTRGEDRFVRVLDGEGGELMGMGMGMRARIRFRRSLFASSLDRDRRGGESMAK